MSEVRRMLDGVCGLAEIGGEVVEILLYKGRDFASVEYEKDGMTYSVTIRSEDKKDD